MLHRTLYLLRAIPRVMVQPRATFREVGTLGTGFGFFLALMVLEFAIIDPGRLAADALRASYDPLSGLRSFLGGAMYYVRVPALFTFAVGIALYYRLRRTPKPLDIYPAASVLGYAWVPHVLLVALGATLAGFGIDLPWLPHHFRPLDGANEAIAWGVRFGPTAALMVIAWRSAGDDSDPAAIVVPPLATATVAILILFSATGFAARNTVLATWDDVRPVIPGDRAPIIRARALADNTPLPVNATKGQVTLIDFWYRDCPPCRASMPGLNEIYKDLSPKGLNFLSINIEEGMEPHVKEFAEELDLAFPIYVDGGTTQDRYRVNMFPSLYLLDRTGTVRHVHIGATSLVSVRQEVEALIRQNKFGLPP